MLGVTFPIGGKQHALKKRPARHRDLPQMQNRSVQSTSRQHGPLPQM